jgi:hypothetical protein
MSQAPKEAQSPFLASVSLLLAFFAKRQLTNNAVHPENPAVFSITHWRSHARTRDRPIWGSRNNWEDLPLADRAHHGPTATDTLHLAVGHLLSPIGGTGGEKLHTFARYLYLYARTL